MHSSIANAGRDIIAQPGRPVLLSGIESLLLNEAHITKYQWILEEGDSDVVIEVTPAGEQSIITPNGYFKLCTFLN